MEVSIDEDKLKELMKQALVEVIEERQGVLYEIVSEVIEDIAMIKAIQEGEATAPVSKQDVLAIIDGQP